MSTRNKIIISVSALCLVAVVAIVAVVAVFAATQGTVTSAVTVTYTVDDISGNVKARYKVLNNDPQNMGSAEGYTFAPETGTISSSLDANNVKLTAANKSVVFEWAFSADVDNNYTAELKLTAESVENITITYLFGEQNQTLDAASVKTAAAGEDYTQGAVIGTTLTVSKAAPQYAYVKFEITDTHKPVSFTGSFAWTLKKATA